MLYILQFHHTYLKKSLLLCYRYSKKLSQISGVKKHKFIILQFYRSEVRQGSHWATTKVLAELYTFLMILFETPFPGLLQLLEYTHIFWYMVQLIHLQRQQCCTFLTILS